MQTANPAPGIGTDTKWSAPPSFPACPVSPFHLCPSGQERCLDTFLQLLRQGLYEWLNQHSRWIHRQFHNLLTAQGQLFPFQIRPAVNAILLQRSEIGDDPWVVFRNVIHRRLIIRRPNPPKHQQSRSTAFPCAATSCQQHPPPPS